MKNTLLKAMNAVLERFGYEARAKRPEPPPITMQGVLDRARQRGADFGTIIDIGAAAGRWTRKALSYFPKARFLLVEPLEERKAQLDELRLEHPAVEFVIAAAGNCSGVETLRVSPDL